jgi:LuxR family maltose regulon positive regulatory protein
MSGLTDQRFMLPLLPPRHLSRPRLTDRLARAGPAGLTLLSAGAGAGKTVLVSEWAGRHDKPVAWLALTAVDNDPSRFWRLFFEAGRATGQMYRSAIWRSGAVVESLDSIFAGESGDAGRMVIVLDDAHLLTHRQILEGLDRIVQRWSHRVRLVVAARSDPLLPLHRYRLAEQMQELRAADLAMTPAEVSALLDEHGVRLADDEVRTLTARTEGWSAGLRLAALRMEGADRPADFVSMLAMDEGSTGEYLTQEILAVLPEHMRSLLVQTSFLETISGSLAEAVTGIQHGGALLADLARTNSFVIPVDASRTTFRYHLMFRELLRQLARDQPVAERRAQYSRAARWYRARCDRGNAIKYGVLAGETAAARTVLTHGGLADALAGHLDLADVDLSMLLQDEPPVGAPAAERLEYDITRRAVAEAAPPVALPSGDAELGVSVLLAEMIAARKAGQFATVDAAAERLLTDEELRAPVDEVRGLFPRVLLIQAGARLHAGRLTDADALLRRAMAETPGDEATAVRLDVLAMLALLDASSGRPRHADSAIEAAEWMLTAHPEVARPVVLDLAVARRAHLAADLHTMAAAMRRAQAVQPPRLDTGEAATVALMQAALLTALGELRQARVLLRDHPAVNRFASSMIGVLRDRELAAIDTALGRPRSALQILDRYRGAPLGLIVELAVARAHLALGDPDRAAASVRTVITTPSEFVDRPMLVDAAICEAEIAHCHHDLGRSAELLERAMQIAADDIVLPFLQATHALHPVLLRHRTLSARWPVPVPPQRRTEISVTRRDALPDMLTNREQAVLRLMTTSMSTAEIADELCLSINTVKTHLAAIYRKLSVGRRREAVSRARQLELL